MNASKFTLNVLFDFANFLSNVAILNCVVGCSTFDRDPDVSFKTQHEFVLCAFKDPIKILVKDSQTFSAFLLSSTVSSVQRKRKRFSLF